MADPSETTQVSLDPKDPEAAELLGAVRTLSAQVGGLQAEIQSLRAQSRPLPTTVADAPGWEDGGAPVQRGTSPWVRSLEGPGPRGPAVPRLLIEIVFLVAVALGAAIAELDPVVIVALMTAAWVLVALAEWMTARAARRQAEVLQAPLAGALFGEDPSWFTRPAEPPVLEAGEDAVDTATKLPPPAEV